MENQSTTNKMKNKPTKNKEINRSVGRRLTALIIFMIVAISVIMMVAGYFKFKTASESYYYRMGEITANVVSLLVDPDSLDTYLATGDIDEKYEDTMAMLHQAREACDAQALYVFTVAGEENGIYYVYDTDTSDLRADLGYFDPFIYVDPDTGEEGPLYPKATENQLREGKMVDTIMGVTMYGWTITVNEPIYDKAGVCKGYVGIDLNVDQVIEERREYLINLSGVILAITAVFAGVYMYIIRRSIIRPINIMAKAADSFLVENVENEESIDDSAILSMEINTGDELQSLAEAMRSMVQKIDEHLTNLNIVTVKSETDGLTLIPNRGAFEQQVGAILRLRTEKSDLSAFMMIDVDYFKAVNDTYGHAAGDMVLTKCADALRGVLRESDVAGRLGGDEFAAFFKSIGSVAKAEEKAKQIRSEWLKIIPPGSDKGITASIGISFTPKDGTGYAELFNSADAALYVAKEAGRDGYALSKPLAEE